jgi:hypothetical protein
MDAKELKELCDDLQKQYTPVISLEQWLFGESPCEWMVADMLKSKRSKA